MEDRKISFTLIELLVVVAIIAVLVAMLLPALSSARTLAKMIQCGSNQRQITMAVLVYAAEENGRFPPSLGMDLNSTAWDGGWPNKLTRDRDGDGKAFGNDELLFHYLGKSLPEYKTFVCPLGDTMDPVRYDLCCERYRDGNWIWLYCSYGLYWNYAQGSMSNDNWFIGPKNDSSDQYQASRMLISDILVYHAPTWTSAHPSSRNGAVKWWLGGAWDIVTGTPSPLPEFSINAGFVDGSVMRINSADIFPVNFAPPYTSSMSLGIPKTEVFKN